MTTSYKKINYTKINYTKIYYKNINLNSITPKVIEKLDKYFLYSKMETRLFSQDGIFVIKNGKIFKQSIIDKPIIPFLLNDIEMLIDESIIEENIILSQLPVDCFQEDITIKYYGTNDMQLVVEFNQDMVTNFYLSGCCDPFSSYGTPKTSFVLKFHSFL